MVKMLEQNLGNGKFVVEGDADFKDPSKAMHLKWDHQWFDVDPFRAS